MTRLKPQRVIVIGSGLGGLSTAALLARNGFDVTVVEQNARPGGCLQCFSRGGVRFETGMHYIGSALPGQPLDRLMRLYQIDGRLDLAPLDPTGYDVINIAGDEFRFANGREGFIETMAGYFPAERDNLVRYFDAVETVAAASSLENLNGSFNGAALQSAVYHTTSISDILDSLFTDPLLKKVIVGNLPLYAGQEGRTPFSQHAFIHDFYNRSAFRIAGGSDAIADALISNIERYGGRLITSARASRILTDSSRATAVEINGDRLLEADLIIAAIHPSPLMQLLGDTDLLRPVFKRRMLSLPTTSSPLSVYLKFKPGSTPYRNHNYYSYRDNPWGCETIDSDGRPHGYLYMHFCDSDRSPSARAGVLIAYMDYELVAPWRGTPVMRRGDDYRSLMTAHAHALIERAAEDFPELPGSIESFYTSSPLTYEDYTSTPRGGMYGVAKDVNLGVAGRVPHRTRIPNLFLAGQNINSHGMLGVLIGTTVMAADILGHDTINNLLNQ